MKELYTSPEAKLTCFAPVENLASGSVEMDDILNLGGNGQGGNISATPQLPGDLEFDA